MISLTRCYRFPAAHVLRSDAYSDEQNSRVFGKCANPAGHGHNYGIEVTVSGPVEEATGELMSRATLDGIVRERVIGRFSHRMLNADELFADLVPTAENIARVVYEQLEAPVAQAGRARLLRVRVHETRKNSFVYGDPR